MLVQRLQRNADYRPAKAAIVFGATTITHSDLLDAVERCARGLAASGVQRGDRIALVLENGLDFAIGFYAIVACGAVAVPLAPESKKGELEFFLSDAAARYVVAGRRSADVVGRVAQSFEQPPRLIVTDATVSGAIRFSDLVAYDGSEPLRNGDLDDDVVCLYSSGSTGRPKCVPRTLVQYVWETDCVVSMVELTEADTILCSIPLYHNYGLVECMLAAAASAARLIIVENPSPFVLRRRHVVGLIERERDTVFPAVPMMFEALLDSTFDGNLSSLRACLTGAAAVPRVLFDGFLEKVGVPIRQHYGCAETGLITFNRDPDASLSAASVGRACPGVSIRILGDGGREEPAGTAGEVAVRSRAMMRGYLGRHADNAAAFRDGYFLTGDIGEFDSDGRLYLLGRKKFVIEVAGQKVDPVEVEDVLAAHESVREAVVIGIPDIAGAGQVVAAYVVANAPCDAQELLAFCRQRLANFKVPRTVELIGHVPKDGLGKIVRDRGIIEAGIVDGRANGGRVGK